MPRWLDHSPSCMWPPLASAASSQCWASVTSSADAYSSARRMRRASCTPAPSSVNRRTPSAAISASGASSLPRPPHGDGAGDVHARTPPSHPARAPRGRRPRSRWRARCWAWRRRPCSPPRAAARRAGLDRLRLLATGLAEMRVQVDEPRRDRAAGRVELVTAAPADSIAGPTAAIAPVAHEHVGAPCAGGVDDGAAPNDERHAPRPPPRPEHEEQHRHPHRNPVGHLAGDHRPRKVGHLGRDLDPAVHGSGVHDDRVVGQEARPLSGETVASGVLARARAAAIRSGARSACAAGRRRRPWAAPRRGRG